jgi:hypothetical protein
MDPETGEIDLNVRPVPPLAEHIMRQTPTWDLIKSVARWIRFNEYGMETGTSTILDPEFLTDPNSGELLYPRNIVIDALKVLGANIVFIQNIQELEARILQSEDTATAQSMQKRLFQQSGDQLKNPELLDFLKGKVDQLVEEGPSQEEKVQMAIRKQQKLRRPK